MRKRIFVGFLAAAALFSLTACGGSGDSGSTAASVGEIEPSAPSAMEDSVSYDYGAAESEYGYGSQAGSGSALQNAKMILTADLELETTEFDPAAEGLSRLTEEMGGYFETSKIQGGGNRWASYTVRIPAENFNLFLEKAGELCHLTYRVTGQENITEQYYDTEGRLKTQQIKLDRLQSLLAKAEAMEDIITIESAISETEYQIEALSGELRHYDALVDFATIHISLNEVYKLSNTEETPDSFSARLGTAFSSGLRAFGDGAENLAVWLAYSWLWLLILAAALFLVFRLLKKQQEKLDTRFGIPRPAKNPVKDLPETKDPDDRHSKM